MKSKIAGLVCVLLLASGCSTGSDLDGPPVEITDISSDIPESPDPDPALIESEMACQGSIWWTKAIRNVGRVMVVKGPVASILTDSNSGATFINIGANYPDRRRFTAVIFAQDLANFGDLSEYERETICVTGDLRSYQGVSQMTLMDPEQVGVYVEP